MSEDEYKPDNDLKINKENLDKDYVEPQMDEEKLKDKKKIDMLSKVNKENLDKNYEEPQLDEEKMKNIATNNQINSDKKESKTYKGEIQPEREKIKVSNSDILLKQEEMMKCQHRNKCEDRNCICPMNCDCKIRGICKDHRKITDLKNEIYDPGQKRLEDSKSSKVNELEVVWDKTKNVITGGIEKAKDMFSKF